MPNIFLTTLPHTEEGTKLVLTAEQEDLCRVVYKKSDYGEGGYIFQGLWSMDVDYPNEYVIAPLRSAFEGTIRLKAGKIFANIIGSSDDHRPIDPRTHKEYGSWRKLMEHKLGDTYTVCCAERDRIYYPSGQMVRGFQCTNNGREDNDQKIWMNGAHVLLDKTNAEPADEGSTVYLLPLCTEHNIHVVGSGSYGTGYYMKTGRSTNAIVLSGYLQKPKVEKALASQQAGELHG